MEEISIISKEFPDDLLFKPIIYQGWERHKNYGEATRVKLCIHKKTTTVREA